MGLPVCPVPCFVSSDLRPSREGCEMFAHSLTCTSLHYSKIIWFLGAYLTTDHTLGRQTPNPNRLLQRYKVKFMQFKEACHTSGFVPSPAKVCIVSSLQITQWPWSSNETMYARTLSGVRKINIQMYISPIAAVHERSHGICRFVECWGRSVPSCECQDKRGGPGREEQLSLPEDSWVESQPNN